MTPEDVARVMLDAIKELPYTDGVPEWGLFFDHAMDEIPLDTPVEEWASGVMMIAALSVGALANTRGEPVAATCDFLRGVIDRG